MGFMLGCPSCRRHPQALIAPSAKTVTTPRCLSRLPTHLGGVLDLRRRTGERERERGTGDRDRDFLSAGVGDRGAGDAERPLLTERRSGEASLPFRAGDADMLVLGSQPATS